MVHPADEGAGGAGGAAAETQRHAAAGPASGPGQEGRLCRQVSCPNPRIAGNGDVANKIGTYTVAVLAREHQIPFYVAAPLSTIDLGTPTGEEIPIEQRDITEVTHIKGQMLVPPGISVANPAFDITPNKLVSAIITEKGVVKAPYQESIAALFEP